MSELLRMLVKSIMRMSEGVSNLTLLNITLKIRYDNMFVI